MTTTVHTPAMLELKCYTPLAMFFVTFLLIANIVASKPVYIGPFLEPMSIIVYPLTYILAVAITEVYGYARARRVIWFAMLCNLLMALFFQCTIMVPPAPFWELQQEGFARVLGSSTRLVCASLCSFLVSEFINAFVIAKMKIRDQGKRFWARALLAMTVSEAAGTAVFATIAFYGLMSNKELWELSSCYYGFKVIYALVAVPFLGMLTTFLKKTERIDIYDHAVNFNPFAQEKIKNT